ncbi:type VI secretion protein IcmF/TssM N-terminal domain-containing protein [Aeoliella mucimassa]|nr:type VI secretion protein IcmF/TssM N-terminal domain-containing protein [Aeoliella mucimassa]
MAVQAPSLVLRQMWLPLMFVVAYAIAWFSWWTWLAWRQPSPLSPYPEIQQAWQAGLTGLESAGIKLSDRQVVFMVGSTPSTDNDILASLEVDAVYGPRPLAATAPVRILADEKAVYISAPGVSALSAQAERWCELRHAKLHAVAKPTNTNSKQKQGTLEQGMPITLRAPALVTAGVATPAESGDVTLQSVSASEHAASLPQDETLEDLSIRSMSKAVSDPEEENSVCDSAIAASECESMRTKFAYLVSLIGEARSGQVPFDGVAIFLPGESLDSPSRADLTLRLACGDLNTLSESSGATAPIVCAFTDVDDVEGCGELLNQLPKNRQQLLLGCDIAMDDATSGDSKGVAEQMGQISSLLTPAICLRLFKSAKSQVNTNRQLFAFQHAIARKRENLSKIVASLASRTKQPWPVAGGYLVATGHFHPEVRGFGGCVMQRLLDLPGRAQWTSDAVSLNRSNLCWAKCLWGVAIALGVVSISLLVL